MICVRTITILTVSTAICMTSALGGVVISDALNMSTVGNRRGGSFTSVGWRVDARTNYIRYIPGSPISAGTVEFDLRGIKQDAYGYPYGGKGEVFVMYDASFGNSDERKADYDNNWEIAKNLKGHILLIHGDIDSNVHPANTMRVVDALIKANKRFDFLLVPGKRHGFGNYNNYVERMRWRYFAEHLLGYYNTNIDMNEF